MANPNIVNVTSIYGESLGEALSTTLDTAIITVASNKLLKINIYNLYFLSFYVLLSTIKEYHQ